MENCVHTLKSFLARLFGLFAALFLVSLPSLAQAQAETKNYVRLLGQCLDRACTQRAALHNENGALQIGPYQDAWWSAQWELLIDQDQGQGVKTTQIRNRWTGALIGAAYDAAIPSGGGWSLVLVKPGEMMRSFKWQRQSRDEEVAVMVNAPMEDFPDSFIWHLVPGPNGTAIINASVMGLREKAPVSKGTALLSPIGTPRVDPGATTRQVAEGSAQIEATTLMNNDGTLNVGAPGWIIQPTGEFLLVEGTEKIRIINSANGGQAAVNIETGSPAAGAVQPGWLSAQWVAQRMAGSQSSATIFQNVWTGKYLGVVNGGLAMVDLDPVGMASGRLEMLNYSWQNILRADKEGNYHSALRNIKTGQYLTLPTNGMPLGLNAQPNYQWTLADIAAPVVAAAPVPDRMVRLRWMKNEAVHIESGPPTFGKVDLGWWSAQWVTEERNGYKGQRIMSFKNRWKGGYLMIRNGQVITGQPDNSRPINEPTDAEEMWVVEGIPSQVITLRHGRTGQYLGNGAGGALVPITTKSDKRDGWSLEEVQ